VAARDSTQPGPAFTIAGNPNLGPANPGAVGATSTFTVTNVSALASGSLVLSTCPAPIRIASNSCASVAALNVRTSCTFSLRLEPDAVAVAGQATCTVTVSANIGSASVQVYGTVIVGDAGAELNRDTGAVTTQDGQFTTNEVRILDHDSGSQWDVQSMADADVQDSGAEVLDAQIDEQSGPPCGIDILGLSYTGSGYVDSWIKSAYPGAAIRLVYTVMNGSKEAWKYMSVFTPQDISNPGDYCDYVVSVEPNDACTLQLTFVPPQFPDDPSGRVSRTVRIAAGGCTIQLQIVAQLM
jgi:hypothetical protein